jgi:hypothetical protein
MTARTARLRCASRDARPGVSPERVVSGMGFDPANTGGYRLGVMRGSVSLRPSRRQVLDLGDDERGVGERGPAVGVVATFPERCDLLGSDIREAA